MITPTEDEINPELLSKPIEVYVAGLMYENRHLAVPSLSIREQVRLVREPSNLHDSNAIKIERENGQKLGYIRRELATRLASEMDKGGQLLPATVTEISSDASGENFRVRIRFNVSSSSRISSGSEQGLQYYYDNGGANVYVLLNANSEQQFLQVREGMEKDGISFTRYGLCYRPANNGRQYQWYIRLDNENQTSQDTIERFFSQNFNVMAEHEVLDMLEKEKLRFEMEIQALQNTIQKHHEEAYIYESLAEEIDTERKTLKQELQNKIGSLEKEVQARIVELGQINDERRQIKYENEQLLSSLQFIAPTKSHDEVSQNVIDLLVDVVSETLTPVQSLQVIKGLFPNRVEILDSAWKSANDSRSFRDRKKLFELLLKLTTEYWYALSSQKGDTHARSVFGEHFSAKESETVEKNRRARQLRTFNYKGKEVEMMKHLKTRRKA